MESSTEAQVTMDMIVEAAEFVQSRLALKPTVGIVCGTGLGELANSVESPVRIPYSEIPHFSVSTVAGHCGVLVAGTMSGQAVCMMQGRLHPYEGHSYLACTFPMRVLAKLGIRCVILTNAAGGLRDEFTPGDIMSITDHFNFPGFSGHSPLRSLSPEVFGERFVPMNNAYDKQLRTKVLAIAQHRNIQLHTGIYAMLGGPHFETPAECRMLRLLGADAVGMSTVHEAIVARQTGMKVIGFSIITNSCVMDSESEIDQAGVHLKVVEASKMAAAKLRCIISDAVGQLDTADSEIGHKS